MLIYILIATTALQRRHMAVKLDALDFYVMRIHVRTINGDGTVVLHLPGREYIQHGVDSLTSASLPSKIVSSG